MDILIKVLHNSAATTLVLLPRERNHSPKLEQMIRVPNPRKLRTRPSLPH